MKSPVIITADSRVGCDGRGRVRWGLMCSVTSNPGGRGRCWNYWPSRWEGSAGNPCGGVAKPVLLRAVRRRQSKAGCAVEGRRYAGLNSVPMVRGREPQRTTLVRQEPVDDVPAVAQIPGGCGGTSGQDRYPRLPVSMVTGEELLNSYQDGALDGILPFEDAGCTAPVRLKSIVASLAGVMLGSSAGGGDLRDDHENRLTTLFLPTRLDP